MKFGEKLAQLMDGPPKIKGADLSKATGISTSMICDMRKGRRVPSLEKLNMIIKNLNITEFQADSLTELWKQDQDPNYEASKKQFQIKANKEYGIDIPIRELETVELSVVGKVSAGRGYINFEYGDETRVFIPSPTMKYKNCCIVNVVGDSMEPEILDDSELIIDRTRINPEENINKIVVAKVNGEVYVKTLRRVANKYYLESINKKYDDIEITSSDEFRLMGKAIEIRYSKLLK